MHGDILPKKPDSYWCQLHRSTHPVAEVRPQWSDLALWFSTDRSLRTLPNVFADLALSYFRQHRRFQPYPNAPKLYSCSNPEAYRASTPIASLIVTREIRDTFPDVPWDALLTRNTEQHGPKPVPDLRAAKPKATSRYYLHGDIGQNGFFWYCAHHDAWHPHTSQLAAHASDAKRLRYQQKRLPALLGTQYHRDPLAPSVFALPARKRGRPSANGVVEGWICEFLGLSTKTTKGAQ